MKRFKTRNRSQNGRAEQTVIGDGAEFALLLEQGKQAVIRLKLGETHAGWKLQAVHRHKVLLEKDRASALVALAPAQPGAPVLTRAATPAPATVSVGRSRRDL